MWNVHKKVSQIQVTLPLPESESLFFIIVYGAWWGPLSAWFYSKPTKTLLLFLWITQRKGLMSHWKTIYVSIKITRMEPIWDLCGQNLNLCLNRMYKHKGIQWRIAWRLLCYTEGFVDSVSELKLGLRRILHKDFCQVLNVWTSLRKRLCK